MRRLIFLLTLALAACAQASKIVLIPLDNRPATGQYAEMIGHIGGADVVMPPMRFLGNYTIPGSPDAILKWLEEQPMLAGDSYVISVDMVCYGGLFESRKSRVELPAALARFRKMLDIRKRYPQAKLYLVSTIMRLTPSATHDATSYRLELARYVGLRSQGASAEQLKSLKAAIPAGALEEYDTARARNHELQKTLIRTAMREPIDLLVLGQDDAAVSGPHVKERAALRAIAGFTPKVAFCEGIDQVPSLLVSRALLEGRHPTVRVLYSDPDGADKTAAFESQPLKQTVLDQIRTSGATEARKDEDPDFFLYINTPGRSQSTFTRWLDELTESLEEQKPIAVADVDLSKSTSSPDPGLYNSLADKGRPMKLLAYAAWNTAANTIGTAIAAANMRLHAIKRGPSVETEIAHKHFLLYRMANDFAYHTFTRPIAYGMTEGPRKDAIFGQELVEVNDYVQRDLSKFLKKMFYENFQGRRFQVRGKTHEFIGMTDLAIGLPWPRPYEVRLEFELKCAPVD
ncbi:MAG: DUF4127 family protein [Fimbriimonas sp.]